MTKLQHYIRHHEDLTPSDKMLMYWSIKPHSLTFTVYFIPEYEERVHVNWKNKDYDKMSEQKCCFLQQKGQQKFLMMTISSQKVHWRRNILSVPLSLLQKNKNMPSKKDWQDNWSALETANNNNVMWRQSYILESTTKFSWSIYQLWPTRCQISDPRMQHIKTHPHKIICNRQYTCTWIFIFHGYYDNDAEFTSIPKGGLNTRP